MIPIVAVVVAAVVVFLVVFAIVQRNKTLPDYTKYTHLGCWNSKAAPNRVFPTKLGVFKTVDECAAAAKAANAYTFIIQFGGECWVGNENADGFKKYGAATACVGGMGGTYIMDVYRWNRGKTV